MVKFPEPSNKAARTGLVITEYITCKNAKQVGKLLHHGPLFWAESKKGPRLLQANAAVKYRCDLARSFAAHKGVGSEFYLQDKKETHLPKQVHAGLPPKPSASGFGGKHEA